MRIQYERYEDFFRHQKSSFLHFYGQLWNCEGDTHDQMWQIKCTQVSCKLRRLCRLLDHNALQPRQQRHKHQYVQPMISHKPLNSDHIWICKIQNNEWVFPCFKGFDGFVGYFMDTHFPYVSNLVWVVTDQDRMLQLLDWESFHGLREGTVSRHHHWRTTINQGSPFEVRMWRERIFPYG